jgi:N-acetylneuraminic acid mutarotase
MKRHSIVLAILLPLVVLLSLALLLPNSTWGSSVGDKGAAAAVPGDLQGGAPVDDASPMGSSPGETAGGEPCLALAPQGGGYCTQPPGPWQVKSPMPAAEYAPAVTSDGVYLYAAGGSNLASASSQLARYDPVTDRWTSLAPMLYPAFESLAVYGQGKIFVFGGMNGSTTLSTTQVYDIASNTWSPGAYLPGPLAQMGGGYYAGKIYVAAGYATSGLGSAQSNTWEYNIAGNSWAPRAALPTAFGGPASGVVNGHLYLLGGRNSVSDALTTTYGYDIVGNTWAPLASTPSPVNAPGAAVYGERIWVFGGGAPFLGSGSSVESSIQSFTTTQIYEPSSNTWTAGPAMNVARSFVGGGAVRNQIIAVGGYNGGVTGVTEVATQTPLRVLIVYSDAGASPRLLAAQLLMLPGVSQADSFNAELDTPTIGQLLAYDVIVPFSNSSYANNVALGNVLADYQDIGGVVVGFNFNWANLPVGLSGRWITGGYSPIDSGATNAFSTQTLGAYLIGHPLMAGVTSLSAFFRQTLDLAPGATLVASWSGGSPLIALKGKAVAVSAYVGDYSDNWSGDFAKVIANAGYMLRHGNGSCYGLVCPGTTTLTGSVTTASALQTGRLFRDSVPSACPGKSCPGILNSASTFHYDPHYFVNNTALPQCVTVAVDPAGCGSNYIFSGAYLSFYNPVSICQSYLGDLGSSPSAPTVTLSYSFTVPAWQSYTVAVNELTNGAGCPYYRLIVSAGTCPASPVSKAFLPLLMKH